MSSAANAPLSNIRERKQGKLLSYFPAPQQLCGARSCGKRARKGHFHGHQHTFTHVEPTQATGRPRHTVQSCGAQAGRFLRGAPGRAAALRRPQLQQPCAKTAWIGSTRPHPRRARRFFCRAASAPEGSAKIRATRRARDRRSPLTVKRTRAGAPPTPQRAIAALAQRPARHGRAQRPRKSGSPAGTRRHRGLCLGAGRNRPRATTPCPSA